MSYAYQLKRITINGQSLHSLTCCNGQIYALCDDNRLCTIVIRVEIVVKDREVVVKLLAFGAAPYPGSKLHPKCLHFLTGSSTELFYIRVGFHRKTDKTPGDVYLFKKDMTSINWKELECLKNRDMIGVDDVQRQFDYIFDLQNVVVWEEVKDLKEGIFVVDLARDKPEFYNPAIGSKLGGYIHIHDKMDKLIYSYHLNSKTIVPSPVPFPVLPTSHMSMWGCWLEDDHREAKFTVDSKQEEDEVVITSITNNEVEVNDESLLRNIPFDVVESIMKFCVGVEYMNFRATCKLCHLAAPLIQWRSQTKLGRLQNYSLVSPWLMVVDQSRGVITFRDPLLGDNYFIRVSQLMIDDETIFCSRFGWLLFRTSSYCPVLFNPFTNDVRKLPDTNYVATNFWFSAPPTSPDCMVVAFSSGSFVDIHYVSGEPTWNSYRIDSSPITSLVCFPTFHDGDYYYLNETGELRVFKHMGEDDISFETNIAEAPRHCSGSPSKYFLVKCEQHLLLVVMGGFGEPIDVFKLNESTREWDKVDGVGKHMIYICDTTCICMEAKIPEMENKIYLPQLSSRNKKIVFYSLETCTFHTFNGKSIQDNLGDVFMTTHLSAHTWIEPSWMDSHLLKRAHESRPPVLL